MPTGENKKQFALLLPTSNVASTSRHVRDGQNIKLPLHPSSSTL
jgi:hypothetical protein